MQPLKPEHADRISSQITLTAVSSVTGTCVSAACANPAVAIVTIRRPQ
jgi:hypothetical protein